MLRCLPLLGARRAVAAPHLSPHLPPPPTKHCTHHKTQTHKHANKQKVQNRCGAWNCLNFTNIEPSRRNAAANSNCMYYGLPSPPGACAGVTAWDPSATTPCVTYNNFGEQRSGVCDPNGYCYYSGAWRGGLGGLVFKGGRTAHRGLCFSPCCRANAHSPNKKPQT